MEMALYQLFRKNHILRLQNIRFSLIFAIFILPLHIICSFYEKNTILHYICHLVDALPTTTMGTLPHQRRTVLPYILYNKVQAAPCTQKPYRLLSRQVRQGNNTYRKTVLQLVLRLYRRNNQTYVNVKKRDKTTDEV